jgi:quercetin dioxygenase-like cupin family protein
MSVVRQSQVALVPSPNGNRSGSVATANHGAREVSVIRQRQRPAGFNPLHYHDREEVMTVLAGTVRVTVDDVAHEVGAGDTVIVPAQSRHVVENTGASDAEWLLIAPAGVQFFQADGQQMSPAWAE